MPILDPSLAYYLCTKFQQYTPKKIGNFLTHYLKISMKNYDRSFQSFNNLIQTRHILRTISQSFVNDNLNITIENKEIFSLKNPYKYLYDKISKNNYPDTLEGRYFVYRNIYRYNFVQLFTDFSFYSCFYFTDSPIVILAINIDLEQSVDRYSFLSEEIDVMNLEISLLETAGLTVIICFLSSVENFCFDKINSLSKRHEIAEIHLFIYENQKEFFDKESRSWNNNKILEGIDLLYRDYDFHGYCYLYTHFLDNFELDLSRNEKLMNTSKFKIISLSEDFDLVFNHGKMSRERGFVHESREFDYQVKNFVFCKDGFDQPRIRIILCNVPIYNNKDPEEDSIPYDISGLNFGYIFKEDFFGCDGYRIPILYNDSKNSTGLVEKYVNFEDIHLIKADFYVQDTLYLARTDKRTLRDISGILKSSNEKFIENKGSFQKESQISLFADSKIIKNMEYVSYAFRHYMTYATLNDNFQLHTNQIFTALEACRVCLLNDKKQSKGVIYQVETGEGKSCIIILIAAVLAISKKTVHIASSNIILSNRDYFESFHFFRQLGLISSVLLHQNEIPILDGKIQEEYYPREFFNESLFKNSSNLNYSVCGINNENEITENKANIVFSTFINFESLYLRMVQMCPSYINRYFNECSLLIDEADSILIDEITNGTILSRPMKTNGNEILTYIYKKKIENESAEKIYKKVKKKWPKCSDITIDDINYMFQEIDIVHRSDFINGRKYSIEKVSLKNENKNKNKNILNEIKRTIENITKKKRKSDLRKNSSKSKNDSDFYEIVFFDYNHKGILEPNKEFGGYIQQFIAIKEKLNNDDKYKNMIIKDVSMNYLYVSHPIFVNLYNKVVGLTGTIGNEYDKQILLDHYNLITQKIPRNKPNHRIELPLIICKDVEERNQQIVEEICGFHQKENPILVIFQDLTEIYDVYIKLQQKGIKKINVFEGKNKDLKPEFVAGLKGAISLGTNVCGRGTDIKSPQLPLHVIISYYTSNSRVIYQAFGRTARNGKDGTVRIICLRDQYFKPQEIFEERNVKNVLDDFQFKNKMQLDFIEEFRRTRNWIFSDNIKAPRISSIYIKKMREARININRISACNFEFPICMSVQTFLDIQSQKIFSLFNCPNCKYTWMLFQRYLQEMLLEAWSLFIDQTDRKFQKERNNISYQKYFEKEFKSFMRIIDVYLPNSRQMIPTDFEMVPTFMNIYELVLDSYENEIMNSFPDKLEKCFHASGTEQFYSYSIGFKPYSLIAESGARINTLDDPDQELNYIEDPELKYMKQQPKGYRSIMISITEAIDGVFNAICHKINEVIGCYTGLKFFLRRTLGGCEFGVCFDFQMTNVKKEIIKNENCIVDKDPLLLFTINVKSQVPVMAGILIIGLVYIAKVAKTISEWITTCGAKLSVDLLKSTVKFVLEQLATRMLDEQIEKFCFSIDMFLVKILKKQIQKLGAYQPEMAVLFELLLTIAIENNFEESVDSINGLFDDKSAFKFNSQFGSDFIQSHLPVKHFLKIGLLLMLCFGSFMLNFHHQKTALLYDTDAVALKFDQDQNIESALTTNSRFVSQETFDD